MYTRYLETQMVLKATVIEKEGIRGMLIYKYFIKSQILGKFKN